MSNTDLLVLVGVIGLLLLVGLTGRRRIDTTQDYFLAGRQLPWWQIGFALFATNFSAAAIVGLTGAAYVTGVAIYNYEWVGIIAMVFFAMVLVRSVRARQIYTISQFLEERYGPRIKLFYSVFVIFLIVFVDMASALYVGGMLLKEVFPFLSINLIVFVVMLLVAAYSVLGGLTAISRTDVIQTIVIVIGAAFVSYYTYQAAGGWHTALSKVSPENLSLIRPIDDRAVPWTGLLTGVPILCAYFWLTNQNIVQWVLSARSEQDARTGLLLAGFMKMSVLFIIVIPGIVAVQLFPGLAQADRIYPTLLFELLPAGVLGIVLAGFVAAIMTSVDSTLHAASTIITMDFVRPRRAELTPKQLVGIGRIITISIIALSSIWSPMIGRFGTLFEYVQGLLSFCVAPFAVVYLAGWFWRGGNERGAEIALMAGLGCAIGIGLLKQSGVIQIHYLHVPLPIASVTALALFLGSRHVRTSLPGSVPNFLGTGSISGSERILAFLLLGLVCLQVYLFR